jgi:glycosyltransferase involved in cell wall biosynthesis
MSSAIRVLELRSVRGTGGGPEKTILNGAAISDPRHVSVTVCYIRDARDGIYRIDGWAKQLGVDFVEVQERHSLDPAVWPQLTKLVLDRGIHIVHAHEYKTDLLAWMLAKRMGTIPLATVHGWTGHSRREQWYYWADKKLLARYPRLIAVSNEIRGELVAHGAHSERITTILNGIDHRHFARDPGQVADARRELGFADGDIVLGAVGRLEPQKRFDLLLDVFAQLRSRHPRLRLVIAGDGSQKQRLETQIERLGLHAVCRLTGHLADVRRAYHAFDLYVQSSDYEGTPNSVLEAMALETPVVATRAGGTEELVHHGVHGWLVPVGDVRQLANAIEQALAAPERARRFAVAARRRVEGELSFERRTAAVERIYASLSSQCEEQRRPVS